MKLSRWLLPLLLPLALACGGPLDEPEADVHLDQAGELDPEAGLPDAPDEPIGEELAEDAHAEAEDPCLDHDQCEDLPGVLDPLDPGTSDAQSPVEGQTSQAATAARPVAGSKMITKAYAGFRRSASATAALIDVAPRGVVPDSRHPSRNPVGLLPPGKTVTLLDPAPVNGFLRVQYAGRSGWILQRKLLFRNPTLTRVRLALQPAARHAFFKHQIRRPRWNKDGPLRSGNCSPTSLAMAVSILGAEPAGLSVEQSIHRVRAKYDPALRESIGTTRSQIETAARRLDLEVLGLRTDLPPDRALTRLNGQLSRGRLVVLNGVPGKKDSGPTLYERAFTRAYAVAIAGGATLRHRSYNYDGAHSILVLGRDASGRYVVADPISEVGYVALTSAEIRDFMTRFRYNRGTGIAVWK